MVRQEGPGIGRSAAMVASVALFLFPLLMAFAAASDLLTMRISNGLVMAVVVAFSFAAFASGLPLAALGMHLAAAAVVLGVAFTMFAFGWIGGGDAKLAAATALWLGFPSLVPYLVYGALLGGALTLLILLARRWPLPVPLMGWGWLGRLHDAKSGVPYGIALAAAALWVYPQSAVFTLLAA